MLGGSDHRKNSRLEQFNPIPSELNWRTGLHWGGTQNICLSIKNFDSKCNIKLPGSFETPLPKKQKQKKTVWVFLLHPVLHHIFANKLGELWLLDLTLCLEKGLLQIERGKNQWTKVTINNKNASAGIGKSPSTLLSFTFSWFENAIQLVGVHTNHMWLDGGSGVRCTKSSTDT